MDEWGIQAVWVDADDVEHRVDDAVIARVREAIGRAPEDLEQTAPVVTRPGRSTGLRGRVVCEDGGERVLDDVVPDDFPLGYHRLQQGDGHERRLIVSPGRCWLPEGRRWGWAVQLYGALSASSQGIGDLADLRTLREWTERLGGGFLLVNPLHAVAPVLPQETSPYLPATRRFRNPLYLRLDDVPGWSGRTPAGLAGGIERDAAWTWKRQELRDLFDRGLEEPARDGLAQWSEQATGVEDFATWCAIAEEHGPDWREWPEELHDPRGEAVRQLVARQTADVDFHVWLQWQLAEQLREATGDLTVVQDLPIGVSGGGADSWAWQDVLATAMTVGAPPDALNTVGQDWGSPPLTPWRLRAADYEPFVQSVRSTIAGAGGLRIDHVMGLFRLWWIPDGEDARAGCYVRYPAEDLLDIVCLESHRAGAVIVGEDLGTVEDGVPEALAERGILSYRLLWFEDDDPTRWPELSLAAVTTHDLPTVAGLWTGSDAEDQRESSGMDDADIDAGRAELLERLGRDGLAPDASVEKAVTAAYGQLGRAPSRLLALSLEDSVAEERRPNVPGTTERDNWSIPLPVRLDDLPGHAGPQRLLAALGVAEPQTGRLRPEAARTPRPSTERDGPS